MKRTNKKIIVSIALIIFTIFIFSNNIFALSGDLNDWDPSKGPSQDSGTFFEKAGVVLGWIQYTGILVSVLMLTIIGTKYMFSSVEDKAEYKKTMGPYILGCFLLMGASIVVGVIANVAQM